MSAEEWADKAKDEITTIIERDFFPCVFAKKSIKLEKILFYFHDTLRNNSDELLNEVINYTNFIKNTPLKERFLSPLIIVFNVNENLDNIESETEFSWKWLQFLLDNDPLNWPDNISKDPYNYQWCFCFNKVQLFINISTPHHEIIKSRNLGKQICFVINPREVFDYVAPIATKKGTAVRGKIRNNIKRYNKTDSIPIELGFYGDKENLEWTQYQLSEDGRIKLKCPLSMKYRK